MTIFSPGEQGLNGRDGADDAALDHRNRQRPHLRNGEIGLHQSVLRLKEAARRGNLRKVIGERFAVRLRRGVEVQPAVAERAVVFDGGGAALFERKRLSRHRSRRNAQEQKYYGFFHHL